MQDTLHMRTMDEFVRHWAETRPEAIALEQEGRTITYGALEPLTARLIALLQAEGVAPGDRVCWLGKNADSYFALFFAAARYGAVMAPIGWRLAPAEVGFIVRDTAARLLVAEEDFLATARKVAEGAPQECTVLAASEVLDRAGKLEPAAFDPAGPDGAVLQLYTSGTTGNPKGAVIANRNMFGLRRDALESELPWTQVEAGDTMLICMPCAHIGGTGLSIITMSYGIRALIQAEFSPEGMLDGVEEGISQIFIVPAALQMVIQHPRAKTTDFSRLRFVMYGAAPIPLELLRQAVETMPQAGFVQCYGMTETTGTISILPPEDHDLDGNERMRSAGKAVPGAEMRIVDEEGAEVPRGTIGEVAIRSPSNMLGYFHLADATASTLRGGWLHTGDAAIMDEDGYVYIQDRIKDVIITGGENVYPAEVESAIYGHPDIAEVAVIGVPDEKWGEAVKACVVARPGCVVEEAGVIAWTRERVAGYKVPKTIDLIEALPRNPSGKILRRQLRAPYWEGRERQVN